MELLGYVGTIFNGTPGTGTQAESQEAGTTCRNQCSIMYPLKSLGIRCMPMALQAPCRALGTQRRKGQDPVSEGEPTVCGGGHAGQRTHFREEAICGAVRHRGSEGFGQGRMPFLFHLYFMYVCAFSITKTTTWIQFEWCRMLHSYMLRTMFMK